MGNLGDRGISWVELYLMLVGATGIRCDSKFSGAKVGSLVRQAGLFRLTFHRLYKMVGDKCPAAPKRVRTLYDLGLTSSSASGLARRPLPVYADSFRQTMYELAKYLSEKHTGGRGKDCLTASSEIPSSIIKATPATFHVLPLACSGKRVAMRVSIHSKRRGS